MSRDFVAAVLLLSGCALTEKGKALDVRYFTPERASSVRACQTVGAGHLLRLGRVRSGPDIEERIVHGDGVYEVGYYDDRRWTARPERYVLNTLGRTLFEECGFQRAVEGDAPTLDVDLLVFQEVKTARTHFARIVLRAMLSSKPAATEDTFTIAEPVVGPDFDDVVAAMARALDAASERVARQAGAALERPRESER